MHSEDEVLTKIRPATRQDLDAIVGLLAKDPLGATRERAADPLPESYVRAFAEIESDSRQKLVVAELDGEIVGTLQLTIMPYLTYQGGTRAQIEAVRVAEHRRSEGIGARLIRWAIARAEERDCHLVQLTTDKSRADARRFYEELGFRSTHEGMKMWLR
jgi:ribosomal protein S18 acetylase RimI-like enzyme